MKPCTCHPSERPFICQRKYANTDCWRSWINSWRSAACITAGTLVGFAIPAEWIMQPVALLGIGLVSGALLTALLLKL